MANPNHLAERIAAEFEASSKRLEEGDDSALRDRRQRLEALDKELAELRPIWRDRLEELAKWFGDRVQVTTNVTSGSRAATFEIQSDMAQIELRFSISTDSDVRTVYFLYGLRIVPALTKYDSYGELSFPVEAIDRHLLVRWVYDRILSFVKTYVAMYENNEYLREHLVVDPIAQIRFPKFAAAANCRWQGQTVYFISDETHRQFEKQHGVVAD